MVAKIICWWNQYYLMASVCWLHLGNDDLGEHGNELTWINKYCVFSSLTRVVMNIQWTIARVQLLMDDCMFSTGSEQSSEHCSHLTCLFCYNSLQAVKAVATGWTRELHLPRRSCWLALAYPPKLQQSVIILQEGSWQLQTWRIFMKLET